MYPCVHLCLAVLVYMLNMHMYMFNFGLVISDNDLNLCLKLSFSVTTSNFQLFHSARNQNVIHVYTFFNTNHTYELCMFQYMYSQTVIHMYASFKVYMYTRLQSFTIVSTCSLFLKSYMYTGLQNPFVHHNYF